jgi:RAB protein geranylgeranyltransferase component A
LPFFLLTHTRGSDPTAPALHRIRRYLRSAGRYGPSPFLVGHYGGAGDIAQGFCRAAAVSGAVYILGRKLKTITHTDSQETSSTEPKSQVLRYSLTLENFPDTLTCNVVISSATNVPLHLEGDTNYLPSSTPANKNAGLSVARCIAIIDRPVYFPSATVAEEPADEISSGSDGVEYTLPPSHQGLDTAVLVFPPSTILGGSTSMAATVLITGEGAMSTPEGRCQFYHHLVPSVPAFNRYFRYRDSIYSSPAPHTITDIGPNIVSRNSSAVP